MRTSSRARQSGRLHFVDSWLPGWLQSLRCLPWRATALTLRERFRVERLGITAGSLTFTTVMSLVPLFTVGLAIFSAFPVFGRMQQQLQQWLIQSLIPDTIARQVTSSLLRFSEQAGKMGWAGAVFLLATALALVLTIDRKLNDIWRVRQPRPLAQRVLVYWAALTLGPLLLGASLSLSSYAVSASRGWVGAIPGGVKLALDGIELLLGLFGLVALYRYVPNARVRWMHALGGALLTTIGIELAKRLLGLYLGQVPTYSAVYGTFATVPILLVWVYMAWVIVLAGAVVTASLPSLLAGIDRHADTPGWGLQLALELLACLEQARMGGLGGGSLESVALRLRVDPLQLEPSLEALEALDWVGRLSEDEARLVLLVDPAATPLAPLLQALGLPREPGTEALWQASGWPRLVLADALPRAVA
ncbi:YihY family inner membrane protein [Malikia sp.]|uniref:YihY family inner membrane protein n=1 Tax=Malikia sp. TaxID=2070706 RepID=UPI0026305F74|nr:YihY family inner membrane protein [Malikia sp.]MDD2728254.1 YihY family inner membrane protein [Malikia sp.]